ncbi:MAG TPA: DUF2878 domain-containing protein [Anaerolineae bacterium]|nr:DUF2878 domain-containing protein [Anaerolineae bacterium]
MRTIINLVGLQVGWWACAWGAATERPWFGVLVVTVHIIFHLWGAPDKKRDIRLILALSLIGAVVDGLFKTGGVLIYAAPWPDIPLVGPIWIVAMWALFATAITTSLAWIKGRLLLAGVLGAIFGPLSYWTGVGVGGVAWGWSPLAATILLATVWGGVMVGLAWWLAYDAASIDK